MDTINNRAKIYKRGWPTKSLTFDSVYLVAIRQIIYELSFGVPVEEILFRGFLWGYFRRRGWEEGRVFWVQGILFWILHWDRLMTPLVFFLGIPVIVLAASGLTLRSKQVFPAILSHLITNAVTAILW